VQPLLLDTCTAIWIAEQEPLTQPALDALRATYRAGIATYVSPITAWEVGLLAAREKLKLLVTARRWFERLIEVPGMRLATMPPDLLIAASFLPGRPPRDPADRILAASAREYGYTLLTRDDALLKYGEQGHIRVLAC
jgi:PIN domain nuclease of toxin-antitoxin system